MEGKVGRRLAEARSEVERVYSYAADTVGCFIDSDELWKSYGSFLESYPREGTDINTQGDLMLSLIHIFSDSIPSISFHLDYGIHYPFQAMDLAKSLYPLLNAIRTRI